MSTEERLFRLENAFVNLTRLAGSLDERLNTQLSWINMLGEAQANSEAKIAALADAQIKTEDALVKLTEAHAKLAESQSKSAESQSNLAESQSNLAESHSNLAEAHAKLAESQAKLAESQAKLADSEAHTDQRLDALIDIVRELRNNKS